MSPSLSYQWSQRPIIVVFVGARKYVILRHPMDAIDCAPLTIL